MDNRDPVFSFRIAPVMLKRIDKYRAASPLYKTRVDVVRYALLKFFEKEIQAEREARIRYRETHPLSQQ